MQTDILAPVVPLLDFNSKTMYILYIYKNYRITLQNFTGESCHCLK